ncbi:MAG: Mov34/MPN/PAD-1 family protein [Candidatus Njordarchaeia archaeon]|nr:Mov34/MPN/PAD-1 family protein [Candidatus Korarchaeota archaeon]
MRIILYRRAYRTMIRYGTELSRPQKESAGVLFGEPTHEYIKIYYAEYLKIGEHAFVELEPTDILRSYIKSEILGTKLVGIYHTHPDFGVTPSSIDLKTMKIIWDISPNAVMIILDPLQQDIKNKIAAYVSSKRGNIYKIPVEIRW